jgi:hypothetical protein
MEWLGSALSELMTALGSLASSPVGYAFIALAAAGTIAMALLQVVKEVTPLRTKYQQAWFRAWIASRAARFLGVLSQRPLAPSTSAPSIDDVEWQIIDLSTGGMGRALYGMPTEDMVTQMKQILPIVLDEPKSHLSALVLLSLGADVADLHVVTQGQPSQGSTSPYFDARARLTRRMDANLDGVKIALSDRWKFWMQLTSLLLTTIVVQLAVAMSPASSLQTHLVAVPIGILGGYFAPITRDLLAALQQLRQS